MAPVHFVVEEKERAVMPVVNLGYPYRAADTEAEVLFAALRAHQASIAGVGERNTGVQSFIGEVIVSAAVELVGALARCEVEKPARDLPEVRRKVARLQRELLDGFDRGLRFVGNARVQIAGGVLAFEDDAECIIRRAVYLDIVPSVDAATWRQCCETQRIPNGARADGEVQRKRIDAVAAEGIALRRILSFQQIRVGGYRDTVR